MCILHLFRCVVNIDCKKKHSMELINLCKLLIVKHVTHLFYQSNKNQPSKNITITKKKKTENKNKKQNEKNIK